MNKNLLQNILIGVFVLFFVIGFMSLGAYGLLQKNKSSQGGTSLNVPIVVWGTIEDRVMDPFLKQVASSIKNKGVDSIIYVEKDRETFIADYLQSVAFKQAPDLILVDHQILFALEETLEEVPFSSFPLNSYQNYFTEASSIFIKENGFSAIPFLIDPLVLFYNENIRVNNRIQENPSYWTDLSAEEYIEIIRRNGVQINRALIPLGAYNNFENSIDTFLTILMQASYPSQLTTDDIGAALEFYKSFSNPTSRNFSWNTSIRSAKQMFLGDSLFFYPGYVSEYNLLRKVNPNLVIRATEIPQLSADSRQATISNLYAFGIPSSNAGCIVTPHLCQAYRSGQFQSIFGVIGTFEDPTNNLFEILPLPPAIKNYKLNTNTTSTQKSFIDSTIISNAINLSTSNRNELNNIIREYIVGTVSTRNAAISIGNVLRDSGYE